MNDSEQTDLSNWLHEPFTQHMLGRIKDVRAYALERLLRAARSSSDPIVAHAAAQYISAVDLEWLFSKGELKE